MTGSLLIEGHGKALEDIRLSFQAWINLHRKNKLGEGDRDLVVEALFLRMVVETENTLDELFWSLMTQDIATPVNYRPVIVFSNEADAKLVISGNKYLDWLPASETHARTKNYFRLENPFSRCPDHISGHLIHVHKIRNFIAHRSVASLSAVSAFVPPVFRPISHRDSIGRYLTSTYQTASMTWFDRYHDCLTTWVESVSRF